MCVCGSSAEVSSKNEWIIQEGENFCKGKLSVKQKQKNIRSILDSFLLKHFQPLPALYYGNPATITNFLDYKSPHSLYYRQYQIVSLTFMFLPSILKSKNSELVMHINLNINSINMIRTFIFDFSELLSCKHLG